MSDNKQAGVMETQQGTFDPTSQAKTFSDQSCRKRSTGSPSRRSHLRSTWQSLSVNPRRRAPTRSGSEYLTA